MTSIQINGLTKRFGTVVAVDNLSFEVAEGSITGFLGPNGAGKTTTLRMLLGLVEPTAGSSTIAGKPYRELADPFRQRRSRARVHELPSRPTGAGPPPRAVHRRRPRWHPR